MKFIMYLYSLIIEALNSRHAILRLTGAAAASSLTSLAQAQATGGLSKPTTALTLFKDNLYIILPIACVIIGIVLWTLYSAEIVRKDTMVRWMTGVLGAGSTAEIVVLLWK